MKAVGLSVIMAQAGMYVPAINFKYHPYNHIMTRICGNDNIYKGMSSFVVEMTELRNIIQRADKNKKAEDKKKELQDFISRFSANASKSKQATSRRKLIDKLDLEEIQPSSRRYPGITFHQERDAGNQILTVSSMTKMHDGETLFKDLSFTLNKGDKIAFISRNSLAMTHFFEILNGNATADKGDFIFGTTITTAYLPNDNSSFFETKASLIEWLRQYAQTEEEKEEVSLRGFLGRMLFSGEEALKSATVLSGGEKVRCMLSRMMLAKANVLMMDEPTNHLDLESITALNNGMSEFQGTLLFTSHDHELVATVANRIIEIGPNGFIDKMMPYDDYLSDDKIAQLQEELYK
jgi:ATPase subunit of ABC transporter with duplicated ATPase domains